MIRMWGAFVAAFIFIAGCGSTSNSTNDAMDNNFTILTGTVPGTLIEAFCTDGSYYGVHSIDNNTTMHPFELTLPKQSQCRLIMSTHDENASIKVITPLAVITPEGSGTLFSTQSDLVDMGHIPLALSRDDINDSNHDGVSDDILSVHVISGILTHVALENDPMDTDGDGIVNVYEDDDNDGICNRDDEDDDNDGIVDSEDVDDNNDGIEDDDTDGDGIKNEIDNDDDNDGLSDELDDDDDNNGINDEEESEDDEKGDGVASSSSVMSSSSAQSSFVSSQNVQIDEHEGADEENEENEKDEEDEEHEH